MHFHRKGGEHACRVCAHLSLHIVNGPAWLGVCACAMPRARRVESGFNGVLHPGRWSEGGFTGSNSPGTKFMALFIYGLALGQFVYVKPAVVGTEARHRGPKPIVQLTSVRQLEWRATVCTVVDL